MIYDNIDFFNIEEILPNGQLLRFPQKLINSLGYEKHKRGRFYGYRSIGSELRFITDSPFFDITLKSIKEDCGVHIFFGDYSFKKYVLKEGVEQTLHIEIPDNILNNYDNLDRLGFNPRVIRIVIGYPGYVAYLGLNTFGYEIITPSIDDVPSKTLLIYGSSISHGSEALDYINSYAFILSRHLNINILNKSIPGSCLGEYQMIDYLKEINNDAVLVEFGVNTLRLFSVEEYDKRLKYIIDNLCGNLYITSVLENGNKINDSKIYDKMNDYQKCLKQTNNKGVSIINPNILIESLAYLTFDLLHPSEFGQLKLAESLKDIIKL